MNLFISIFILFFGVSIAQAKTTHMVLLGGFNSCGWAEDDEGYWVDDPYLQRAFTPFSQVVDELYKEFGENGEKIIYTVTCFDTPTSTPTYVYVRHSLSSEQIKLVKISDLNSYLRDLVKDADQEFLIGHSYGGWLAMKLLETANDDVRRQLVTIDPISGYDCNWWVYITMGEGCHSAPSDLDNPSIAENSDYWINYYQRDHTWLNSSAVDEADENIQMHYDSARFKQRIPTIQEGYNKILGHNEINTDPRLWQDIHSFVKKSL